jgi:hypothetical protein
MRNSARKRVRAAPAIGIKGNEFDSTPQQQKAAAAYLSADLEFPMPIAPWRYT